MSADPARRACQALPCAELPTRMVHPLLPFPRPPSRRSRSNRHPFTPAPPAGPYRLPRDVRDRLGAALVPYRNRDAAFALATFLGRFWSAPNRLLTAFPIDRRELANHAALGLTEARVRGAIKTLEEAGFLDRAVASGSTYQPTPDGLHRKPVLFMFGAEYGPLFGTANKRAAAARERRSGARGTPTPATPLRPSAGLLGARLLNSPKNKSSEADKVLMGEITTHVPRAPELLLQNSALDAALDRWKLAFEKASAQGSAIKDTPAQRNRTKAVKGQGAAPCS